MKRAGFFTQPVAAYRDFQLAYGLLFLNFAIPSLSYVFAPRTATDSYQQINRLLGGGALPFPEWESVFYWVLGCANVLTLAFCCFYLMWNLRAHYPALLPLTFLKSMATLLWLAVYLSQGAPVFLGAAILDALTCVAFVFFARRARRAIEGVPDDDLLPRPRPGFATP